MASNFQLLPGAERFSQHLRETLDGMLTADGPEIVDRSYGVEYTKIWIVKLNGTKIGEYLTFGPKPGETEFGREFRGRIPGYINRDISLVYTNQIFVEKNSREGPGIMVDTPWQRQDGHDQVPFP